MDRMSPATALFVAAAADPQGDQCVTWQGAVTKDGYARAYHDGRVVHVTHLVLMAAGHPRPDSPGNQALHTCPGGDNPRCCSARHLRWGTHSDNQRDSVERGTQRPGPRGAASPFAHLAEEDVRDIRHRYRDGVTQVQLAADHGVTQGTISKIIRRSTWAHLTDEMETA